MKVLVCGGRDFKSWLYVETVLDHIDKRRWIDTVIVGGATGADALAEEWARDRGKTVIVFPANWKKHGHRAGPIRNQQMIDQKPDLVIAFRGGRGTDDTVRRARLAGIEVDLCEYVVPVA